MAKDIKAKIWLKPSGNHITRDFLEGPEATDPEVRRALMNTWVAEDMTDVPWRQKEPDEEFFKVSVSQ